MATAPSEDTVVSQTSYLYCGEECSQDTGPARGSMPSPRSFQESYRSFYTECRSCTPTQTQQWHITTSISGPRRVHTANKMHKLSIIYDSMAFLTLINYCVIYIILNRFYVAKEKPNILKFYDNLVLSISLR